MYIKSNTVIPVGMKIVRLAPSKKAVKSLYSLEKAEERELEIKAETDKKVKCFTEALINGYSAREALKIIYGT